MSISGRIETVSFHGILQLLCKENKTGILRIRNTEGSEYQFFLLDGNILYAIEAFKEARLGTMLVNDGVTTKATIDQCVEKAKRLKVALGKVLVEESYISSQLMEHYLYKQILEILTRVIHWEQGEFSYRRPALQSEVAGSTKVQHASIVDGCNPSYRRTDACPGQRLLVKYRRHIFIILIKFTSAGAQRGCGYL